MSRPIEFRIFYGGSFLYWGFRNDGHGECFAGIPDSNVESLSIEDKHKRSEQFIGRMDKNGVKVFEGDIVFDPSEYGGKKIVQWNVGLCRFEFDKMLGHSICDVKRCEVIGNRWENPELLEGI